jgi:hypothetical protein
MGLQIETTWAQLQVQTTPAKVNIETSKAKMDLTPQRARMEVSGEPVQITIDQTQCFAETGLKRLPMLVSDWAGQGRQAAMEYIAAKAQQGDAFANLRDKRPAREVLAAMAEQAYFRTSELNIDVAPKTRPEIGVTGGKTINWNPPSLSGNYTPGSISYQVVPGSVNITWSPPGAIKINYTT